MPENPYPLGPTGRRRMCERPGKPKRRFATVQEARAQATRIPAVGYYLCPSCHYYHIGKPGRRLRNRRFPGGACFRDDALWIELGTRALSCLLHPDS